MLLVLEVGLLVFGIITLTRGRMVLSSTKVVEGGAAYVLGILAVLPLPLMLGVGFCYGFMKGLQGKEAEFQDNRLLIAGIEAGIVLLNAAMVFGIGAMIGTNPKKKKKKRKRQESVWDEEEEDDDRPVRRSRNYRSDEEPEEDERPTRKRPKVEDDYDRPKHNPQYPAYEIVDDKQEDERPAPKRVKAIYNDDDLQKKRRSWDRE